jgi:uncharacterized iron-regulated membrane protein
MDQFRNSVGCLPNTAVADKTVVFTLDAGLRGRPQLRSTSTVDKATGSVIKAERFEDFDPGLRACLWMRMVHTGEYHGFSGQTVAGIASVACVILVWTGFALTRRRFIAPPQR